MISHKDASAHCSSPQGATARHDDVDQAWRRRLRLTLRQAWTARADQVIRVPSHPGRAAFASSPPIVNAKAARRLKSLMYNKTQRSRLI